MDGFGWCDFFFKKPKGFRSLKKHHCLESSDPKLHTDLWSHVSFRRWYLATPITRPYPILPNWWLSAEKRLPFSGALWYEQGRHVSFDYGFLLRLCDFVLWGGLWQLILSSMPLDAPLDFTKPLLAKCRNIRQKSPKMIFLWTSIILVSLLTPCLDFTAGCSGST